MKCRFKTFKITISIQRKCAPSLHGEAAPCPSPCSVAGAGRGLAGAGRAAPPRWVEPPWWAEPLSLRVGGAGHTPLAAGEAPPGRGRRRNAGWAPQRLASKGEMGGHPPAGSSSREKGPPGANLMLHFEFVVLPAGPLSQEGAGGLASYAGGNQRPEAKGPSG